MFHRCVPLLKAKHLVIVTRDMETVRTYLENCEFDVICLDYDLKRSWTGYDVVKAHLLDKNIPIVVHSMNPKGAARIDAILTEHDVKHTVCRVEADNFVSHVESFVNEI